MNPIKLCGRLHPLTCTAVALVVRMPLAPAFNVAGIGRAFYSRPTPFALATRSLSSGRTIRIVWRELMPVLAVRLFASRVSALINHVARVISNSAQKKMGRIDARRIVTMVAYRQAFRYSPVSQLPRQPVGEHFAASDASSAKFSVAPCRRSGPKPARIGLRHLRPETVLYRSEVKPVAHCVYFSASRAA